MFLLVYNITILLFAPIAFFAIIVSVERLLEKPLQNLKLADDVPKSFVPNMAWINFFTPSWIKRSIEAGIALRFEVGNFRPLHFFLASAILGIFATIAYPLVYLTIRPQSMILCAILLYLLSFRWKSLWCWAVLLFACALFSYAFELELRQISFVRTSLIDSDLIWFLTDGRWLSCIGLFLGSTLIAFFLRVPYLVFWTIVIFYFVQMISLNGLLFAFAGEIFGGLLIVFFKMRNIKGTLKIFWRQWLGVATLGLIAGLILSSIFITVGIAEMLSFEEQMTSRWVETFLILACVPVGIVVSLMIWGHLTFGNFTKDFRSSGFVTIRNWDRLIFPSSWSWWEGIVTRQHQILEQANKDVMSVDAGKLPPAFRDRVVMGLKDLNLQLENLRTFLKL